MKRFVLFLFLSVFTLTVAFASVSLHFFTAKSNSDGVLIEWKTGDENGVTRFEIERSAGSMENFYSNTISVMYTVSGIKDTWGSIKAIFR